MSRCEFCFRDKPNLASIYPELSAKVCKACSYEIDKVVGFFEHYGFKLYNQTSLFDNSVDKTKPKSRATKSEKDTEGQDN